MASLLDFEEDIRRASGRAGPHTPFVEVVAQQTSGAAVRLDRTATSVGESPHLVGAAFRAWGGDRWIEVASRLDGPDLDRAIDGLNRQLDRVTDHGRPPGEPTTGNGEHVDHLARPMEDFATEDRIAWARELFGYAKDVPSIVDVHVVVASGADERLYLNSAGGRKYQVVPRAYAVVAAVAKEGETVRTQSKRVGGLGGREQLDGLDEAGVRETAGGARALLHAKTPPVGAMNVLLDPGVAGVLAHESFGHGTEADQFVRGRSYLRPLLGSVVGPECLSIVDDGSFPHGWGSVYFDDEGHPGARTTLIDRGKFVGILHDRTTAAQLGGVPTGNSRRADFLSRVWVRMTNTMVVPGDRSREELLEEAKDGVLLESWISGIEDPLGGQMQIKVNKGHLIRGGELTDLVGSMALSGRVLDVLRSVKGVSRVEKLGLDIGYCGKGHGDYIPDGTGGGYLLTRAIVGPT